LQISPAAGGLTQSVERLVTQFAIFKQNDVVWDEVNRRLRPWRSAGRPAPPEDLQSLALSLEA